VTCDLKNRTFKGTPPRSGCATDIKRKCLKAYMYIFLLLTFTRHEKLSCGTLICQYKTDERESPQEASPARENSSLGFIEAVHQW